VEAEKGKTCSDLLTARSYGSRITPQGHDVHKLSSLMRVNMDITYIPAKMLK
jgi:hypothetical protein